MCESLGRGDSMLIRYHVERVGLEDINRFGIFDNHDTLLNQFIFKQEEIALQVCQLLNQDIIES